MFETYDGKANNIKNYSKLLAVILFFYKSFKFLKLPGRANPLASNLFDMFVMLAFMIYISIKMK